MKFCAKFLLTVLVDGLLVMGVVTMSGTQRPSKKVATLSQRKRVRSGGNVPPTPAVPRGQTRRFRVKIVVKEGKLWWKKHTKARYFSDVCIDKDNFAREFPPDTKADLRVTYGVYLCRAGAPLHGHHPGKGLLGLCLDDAHRVEHGAILKLAMRKARVYKGRRYAFEGLIIILCRAVGVPKEKVDYMEPLFPAPVDITRTKGPDTEFGPTLTTAELHRHDELIMASMYGLEILAIRMAVWFPLTCNWVMLKGDIH
ncbi:hypothetical protein H5410_003123 [Solanum commersonii]|uniref:Uncharacterized protein n=1 Tax=Solanum commersonii TaxID=4109 RepID=A0A9J6B3U6_SOLCO|nr:hypothetical protein H5410_003123 [Solanum commersonii]